MSTKKSTKKPVVIFDIDFTLFNTAAFRRNLYKLLAQELGYSDLKEFYTFAKQTEGETKEQAGFFAPRLFLSLLQKKAKNEVTVTDLEKIFFNEAIYIESLYEDARDVFQELVMKKNIEIVIFSTGEKEFQMQKIKSLRAMLNKDHIHIFVNKLLRLKDVLLQYKKNHIYLVDDMQHVLYEAQKLDLDITTVWINHIQEFGQQEFFDDQETIEDFTPDRTITQLNEIIPFVSL